MKKGTLYWITGLSGSGKTTVGNRLYYELRQDRDDVILLDGDILKGIVNEEPGYEDEDRRKRGMQYARICKMLTDQGITVICCTVAMYDSIREWNRKNNKAYIEVFLDVPMEILRERDQKGIYTQYQNGKLKNIAGMDLMVEFPKKPDLVLKTDGSISIRDCVNKILDVPIVYSEKFQRDTAYWNSFYGGNKDIKQPSLFAEEIGKRLIKSKNILDLGCGNGRDSIFFRKLGMNVTAVDASNRVIEQLKETYTEDNIYFICDDFVSSSAIFSGQYDYVYSRFSLHAIDDGQETEVLNNVYKVLKQNGQFFIEARSIHDELYGKGKKIGKHSYIYDDHFRRFIEMDHLILKMQKIGFKIEDAQEARGFAPYQNSNPPIIRIIAKK